MPDLMLTEAEREAVQVAWDTFKAQSRGTYESLPDAAVAFVVAVLSAVPRLALAAPMVGELVALVKDYDRAYCEVARDNESREAFYPALTRDVLQARLAALTGEEGRDNAD